MSGFEQECLSCPHSHSCPSKMLEKLLLSLLNRRVWNLTPRRTGVGVEGWMETWRQGIRRLKGVLQPGFKWDKPP